MKKSYFLPIVLLASSMTQAASMHETEQKYRRESLECINEQIKDQENRINHLEDGDISYNFMKAAMSLSLSALCFKLTDGCYMACKEAKGEALAAVGLLFAGAGIYNFARSLESTYNGFDIAHKQYIQLPKAQLKLSKLRTKKAAKFSEAFEPLSPEDINKVD